MRGVAMDQVRDHISYALRFQVKALQLLTSLSMIFGLTVLQLVHLQRNLAHKNIASLLFVSVYIFSQEHKHNIVWLAYVSMEISALLLGF